MINIKRYIKTIIPVLMIIVFVFFGVYKLVQYAEYTEEYSYELQEIKDGTYAIYYSVSSNVPANNYDVVTNMIKAAKDNDIDFAVDVYPFYGSDVDVTLGAGFDIRHGLIGAGVYASHGYERSHRDGVENTLRLLMNYCK